MSVKHTSWKLAALMSACLCTSALAHAQPAPEAKPKVAKHKAPAEKTKLAPPSPTPPPAAVPDASPVTVASNHQPKPVASKPKVLPPQPTAATTKRQPQPTAAGDGESAPQPPAADVKPVCSLAEAEQPRGGRLEVVGDSLGASPVVRIAGKPARMIERRPERISVQIPADSNGGAITLLHEGKQVDCGTLVIIGKNR